ncbi:MAG: hypothetical protein NZL95_06285, partial [Chitinophagales bacterium]|nr:hypothetical protein [Chitinophagales bacterium]MDW8428145.1 hypothetical protein [Chitinophagales bacterium]
MKFQIALLLLVPPFFTAQAQFTEPPQVFDSRHGLQQNTVSTVHFDRDGLLWCSTEAGICRIDG